LDLDCDRGARQQRDQTHSRDFATGGMGRDAKSKHSIIKTMETQKRRT
jgi:hypothetical protein